MNVTPRNFAAKLKENKWKLGLNYQYCDGIFLISTNSNRERVLLEVQRIRNLYLENILSIEVIE